MTDISYAPRTNDDPAPGQYLKRAWFWCAIAGLIVAASTNAIAIWRAAWLREVPPGSSVDPVGPLMFFGFVFLTGVVVSSVLAAVTLVDGWRVPLARVLGITVAVLAFASVLAADLVWNHYMRERNLTIDALRSDYIHSIEVADLVNRDPIRPTA